VGVEGGEGKGEEEGGEKRRVGVGEERGWWQGHCGRQGSKRGGGGGKEECRGCWGRGVDAGRR